MSIFPIFVFCRMHSVAVRYCRVRIRCIGNVPLLWFKMACKYYCNYLSIECVRSCEQRPYLVNETKGWICIRIEFNSQKNISLLQHGRHDVMWTHSIDFAWTNYKNNKTVIKNTVVLFKANFRERNVWQSSLYSPIQSLCTFEISLIPYKWLYFPRDQVDYL